MVVGSYKKVHCATHGLVKTQGVSEDEIPVAESNKWVDGGLFLKAPFARVRKVQALTCTGRTVCGVAVS